MTTTGQLRARRATVSVLAEPGTALDTIALAGVTANGPLAVGSGYAEEVRGWSPDTMLALRQMKITIDFQRREEGAIAERRPGGRHLAQLADSRIGQQDALCWGGVFDTLGPLAAIRSAQLGHMLSGIERRTSDCASRCGSAADLDAFRRR